MDEHTLAEAGKELRDRQEKMNAYEAQTQACGAATLNGYGGRKTLRDRLKANIEDARNQRDRLARQNELFALLEKNPEIARILELIEEIGL
jgi:hypothetical protein